MSLLVRLSVFSTSYVSLLVRRSVFSTSNVSLLVRCSVFCRSNVSLLVRRSVFSTSNVSLLVRRSVFSTSNVSLLVRRSVSAPSSHVSLAVVQNGWPEAHQHCWSSINCSTTPLQLSLVSGCGHGTAAPSAPCRRSLSVVAVSISHVHHGQLQLRFASLRGRLVH